MRHTDNKEIIEAPQNTKNTEISNRNGLLFVPILFTTQLDLEKNQQFTQLLTWYNIQDTLAPYDFLNLTAIGLKLLLLKFLVMITKKN